jgi:hypothetical protein
MNTTIQTEDFTEDELQAALATLVKKQRAAAEYVKAISAKPEAGVPYPMLTPRFTDEDRAAHWVLFIREMQAPLVGHMFRPIEGEGPAITCWLLPGANYVPVTHCEGEFRATSKLGRMHATGLLDVLPPGTDPKDIARLYRNLDRESLAARVKLTNSGEDLEWLLENVLKPGDLAELARGRLSVAKSKGDRVAGAPITINGATK